MTAIEALLAQIDQAYNRRSWLEGSNWFARPRADAARWRADVRLLDDCHRRLRETVAGLDPRRLPGTVGGSTTGLALVTGIIAHDLYHAGQIQLLKRMRT